MKLYNPDVGRVAVTLIRLELAQTLLNVAKTTANPETASRLHNKVDRICDQALFLLKTGSMNGAEAQTISAQLAIVQTKLDTVYTGEPKRESISLISPPELENEAFTYEHCPLCLELATEWFRTVNAFAQAAQDLRRHLGSSLFYTKHKEAMIKQEQVKQVKSALNVHRLSHASHNSSLQPFAWTMVLDQDSGIASSQ